MNFVWILGSASKTNDEIRYSIRSVLKYHPNSTVTIIGEKPEWYLGEHYYIPDNSSAFVNKWNKMIKACSFYDYFIQMDDDFYLLEPYRPRFYYNGLLKERRITPNSNYGKMVLDSLDWAKDEKNYLLHTPLPVLSKYYPKVILKGSPRQLYCIGCDKFPSEEMEDVKFADGLQLDGLPFFSIDKNISKVKPILEKLYPIKSKFEK